MVKRQHHPLPAGERPLRRRVELGAELRERLELAVLGQLEPEPAGDLHRLGLGARTYPDTEMPTFTAGRTPEKKRSTEVDLAVRDRDDVGRDVRGHVPRLRLDQWKRGQRAAAELRPSGSLQARSSCEWR